jgi:tetratricopeptide (TPR) repeat protein
MISFHKLILSGLLAVLPFAPDPVFAQTAGLPEGSASDLSAGQHPGGDAGAYHPFIPAKLLSRLPAVVAAAGSPMKTADAGRDAAMAELQQALGVSRTQLLNFCRIVGEAGTRPWLMGDRLADISRRHGKLLARVKTLSGRLIPAGEAKVHLLEELEAGNLTRAYRLMEEAGRSNQAPATAQPAVASALVHDLLGEIAQARLNYRQAADHFREAAGLLPSDQTERRLFYLESAAYALFRQGDDYGDSEALAQSADQYRGLALARSRGKEPLSWGTAHHNLGTVLWVQGMREGSMTLLEEAAEAFRAALLTRTRARVPLLCGLM